MVTVNLNGCSALEAYEVAQVFKPGEALNVSKTVRDEDAVEKLVRYFVGGGFGALLFQGEALANGEAYSRAVEAVQLINVIRPDALRVVVFKFPKQ